VAMSLGYTFHACHKLGRLLELTREVLRCISMHAAGGM
jgi:hypothetical protein